MAAAPTAVAPQVSQKLTKDDLVKYLASGCKPRDKWRWAPGTIYQMALLTDTLTLHNCHVCLALCSI